jgi:hypothetical protein
VSRDSSDRIILCQPDNTKGCSLCCGLFNFSNISPESLRVFLEQGRRREEAFPTHKEYRESVRVRDLCSHICPYQGFLSEDKPGCLIHPLSSGIDGRWRSLFASKICGEFFCPAHTILTDEEKKYLIENVSDWYKYSAAIADPESYSFIYNYVKDNFSGKSECLFMKEMVEDGLAAHAVNLASYNGAIFCYSIPEYNINKKNFSVKYIDELRDVVVSSIERAASAVK